MMSARLRFLFCLAVGVSGHGVWAQDSAGTGGTTSPGGTGGTGTGTGGRSPSSLLSDSPFSGGTTPSTTTPGASSASPSFRTGAASTLPEATPGTTPAGAASSFGAEPTGAEAQTRAAPTTFSLPGLYGRGPQEFTVGQGALARPRFRVTANVSVGFDDNVFQTPTNPTKVPDQEVQILVTPATPATTRVETVPSGDPLVPDTVRVVPVPAQEAVFRTERVPGLRPPERISSMITRAEAQWNIQLANRRNLFTFDLKGSAGYYWDRPGDKTEYTGALSFIYLRKLTGRAQFTAALNASYQDQPDFSQINGPTTNTGGTYLAANAKADLSYRLTPRFSSVTSVAYNAIHYTEEGQEFGNYGETTFGTELRYLFSPRFTLLGEVRYGTSVHDADPARDTTTYYILAGGELRLSRRFVATLRLGESIQTFEESGEKSSSPYLEATLSYRLARGTDIYWNARYGYEESGSADSRSLVARTGLTLKQIFSPRFQGALALNLLRNETTTETQVTVADGAPTTTIGPDGQLITVPGTLRTEDITLESVQNTIDATLSLQYVLSRRWSFNFNYSYTMVIGPEEPNDYYRQRLFFGAGYLF